MGFRNFTPAYLLLPPPLDERYAGLFGFIWLLRLFAAALEAGLLGFITFERWSLGEGSFGPLARNILLPVPPEWVSAGFDSGGGPPVDGSGGNHL